jgi:hypothetical protein
MTAVLDRQADRKILLENNAPWRRRHRSAVRDEDNQVFHARPPKSSLQRSDKSMIDHAHSLR